MSFYDYTFELCIPPRDRLTLHSLKSVCSTEKTLPVHTINFREGPDYFKFFPENILLGPSPAS
jgi:hypothetical protein